MTSETVAAVIPTLNRRADLLRCLDAVAGQTRRPGAVFVVDNGSADGTREALGERSEVTPLALDHNAGAPGGFEAGMAAAMEGGAGWLWLLDDDAVPEPEALERLLARVANAGRRVGGAAPTVRFGDGRHETGWLWGDRAEGRDGQSPNLPDGPGPPAEEVDWGPFAGLLVASAARREIGPVRSDFRLWHADVEFCLRMRQAGWRIVAAPDAVVRHPAMPMLSRRVLGRTVTVGRIPPWREYYDTRNRAILDRQLHGTPFDPGTGLVRRAGQEVARAVAVLVADRAGPRRVAMRILGAVDGRRGHMGRRPEPEG